MSALRENFAEWSCAAWMFIGNHLWQSTLFATLAILSIHFLKSSPARARYTVWIITLIKFALPALFITLLAVKAGVDFSHLVRPSQTPENARVFVQVAEPIYQPIVNVDDEQPTKSPTEIYSLLTFIWLTGFLFFLMRWLKQRHMFMQAVRAGSLVVRGKEAETLK